ncbi:MAG TPA: LysM domain-containing protein, partial [Candidatus Melainabacteria bacterium]|nr:LysM domain-containing protein [Candidatus Melainabacteria bacterium]
RGEKVESIFAETQKQREEYIRAEQDQGVDGHAGKHANLADVVADELAKIHQAIESRLQDLHHGDSDYNPADDWSGAAHGDIASRQEIMDMESREQDRIDRELEQDRINDKREEEEKRREDEEERLKKRKEEIKKLTDTMMTVLATRRRAELERIRKLLEQQRKVEEFIAKDTRRSKHTVKEGESLESIARRFYKDHRIAKLIADLNKGKVTAITTDNQTTYEVKAGVVLTMPSPREAREWIMRRKHLSVVDAGFIPQGKPMSAEERQQLDNKKANVESLLGSLGLALDPNHKIKYIVRLGDSLRSIAMKHPHLNDITLWRLLAEKNQIPVDTDVRGVPVAAVTRGTTLVLPTRDEINEFKRANGALVHPSSSKFTSRDVATSVRFAKDCGSCNNTVPAGVSMCPSCGHVFDSKTSITGLKTIFSAVSKERKGVKTKEYKELPTLEETLGVKTVVDPLAPVG